MNLFTPDVFSASVPVFSVASEADRAEVIAMVETAFSRLGAPQAVDKNGGQEINSNNFRVETNRALFVIKRIAVTEATLAHLRAQAELSEILRNEGVPMAPFERADDGGLVVQSAGVAWSAQRFVPGHYFSGKASECASVATALQRLNEGCLIHSDKVAQADATPFVNLDPAHVAWVGLEKPETFASFPSTLVDLIREHRSFIVERRDALRVNLNAAEAVELCHIDIHPHNLLMADADLMAVLDFESLKPARRRVLVAYGCYKLLRQAAVNAGAGYRDALSSFRLLLRADQLLQTTDRQAQADLASAEIMRRLCVVLELNVTKGDRAWNHMLEVMIRALYEVQVAFGTVA